eukprot:Skav211148  [mRNA]  locus=scaffold413:128883:133083:+ [translate_table: standard]
MVKASRINEWFQFAARAFLSQSNESTESEWKVVAERSGESLSFGACPWGGRVVKFDFKNFHVPGAEDPSHFLLRPEVRSRSHDRFNQLWKLTWQQTIAPGDAVVEETNRFGFFFLGAVLFSRPDLPCTDTFFCNLKPNVVRHQRRRDFPEVGDYAYAHVQDGQERAAVPS